MKKYVFLYQGYEEPGPDTMDTWMNWFKSIEGSIVDSGNPFGPGREVTADGARDLAVDRDAITGYTIVNADNIDDAEKLLKDCPSVGGVRVYEAIAM